MQEEKALSSRRRKAVRDRLALQDGPIFPSGCEGKLGVALESLQGLRDLTYAHSSTLAWKIPWTEEPGGL